ncbi:MAG TPA: AAA family ATPase, partial [Candidatus Nitrosotalea sp.]|nr:AAA family ATPase [Candidatus Nitrosotalea sp.]
MKINEIEISNFRSLKSIEMKDLGNLVVLIGPNSVGKSNLLEALQFFFWQLHLTQFTFLSPLPDYLWYDRDTDQPIIISLTLSITKNEAKKIIPLGLQQNYAILDHNTLKITRKIFGPESTPIISTTLVSLNSRELFKDEKVPTLPKSEETAPVDPNSLNLQLFVNISNQISSQYKIMKSITNEYGQDLLGERNSIIPVEIISQIQTVGGSLEKKQMKKWQHFGKNVRSTSNEISDVSLASDQVVVTEKNTENRIPIHLVGGGDQEIVTISHQLSSDNRIFGIEEPETHLNPQLARKLFQFFKDISNSKQLFIVTHSTIFVDMGDLANTWIATKNQNGTSVKRPSQPIDLKRMLSELGTRPSDILYSNAILFVEGHSDKTVYPTLANKLGIDFDSYGLGLISIRGNGSGK